MSEGRERTNVDIDDDVADWVHQIADDYYNGDVQKAMNVMLTTMMKMHQKPDDVWGPIEWEATTRRAAARRANS
jgi:hypothetical protein